ncbi:MAG: DUF2911 domain-containing protein [Gemmatimonadota bacterium]
MYRALTLTLLLAACSRPAAGLQQPAEPPVQPAGPVEQYAFFARLGNDTISVERVSRSGNSLISDDVDRFPSVKLRHTEFEIAPDGRLTRMVMDIRTPSGATPAERWRRVVAHFTNDSVMVTIRDSSGVTGRNFATEGALTVPHVSMLYSVIEFEIASAMRRAATAQRTEGGSLPFRQFYPDRDVGPRFVLHRGQVMPKDDGKVELQHDWLAGTGDVTVDSLGRMLTYSGQHTTYKVSVTRSAELPDIATIGAAFAASERQAGAKQLSVRDTARGIIGVATIAIDYGRPLARGRVLLGNVIEYDRIWRTGANAATQLTTSAPITLAGLQLAAGTYTLWSAPHQGRIELIVNKESGQWGTEYDRTQDLGAATLATETLTTPVEEFTISVVPTTPGHGKLVLEWGSFRWMAPIVAK